MISLPLFKCVLSKHHLLAPEGAKLQRMDKEVLGLIQYILMTIYIQMFKNISEWIFSAHPPEV